MENKIDIKASLLTPELILKAEEELNEIPHTRSTEIQAFRDMVRKVHNLKAQLSDEFLIRFLRARKFDKDRALKLIVRYYKIKANNPTILGDLLPSNSVELVNANIVSALPYSDEEGRIIVVIQVDRLDPWRFSAEHFVRSVLFLLEAVIPEDSVQICGIVVIFDLEKFNWRHLQLIRPMLVAKLVRLIQDSFPARFKAFHAIRESALVDIGYSIFKPFLSAKLKKRVFFHGYDMKSLHRHISPSYLPSDFGGLREPIDYNYWSKQVFEKEHMYRRLLQNEYVEECES